MASDDPFGLSGGQNVENEARKTVDTSWDSPFHTLGKGATQAAPGNHGHPENLTPDELIAGANITISKNTDGSVTINGATPGEPLTEHGALTGRTLSDQHSMGSVTGLVNALNDKSPTTHSHTGYATSGHNHSGVYAPSTHYHDYAATNHGHSGYAASSHGHSPGQVGIGYGVSDSMTLAGGATGRINVPHNLGRTPTACTATAVYDGGGMTVPVSIDGWTASYVDVGARNLNNSTSETFRVHVIVVG